MMRFCCGVSGLFLLLSTTQLYAQNLRRIQRLWDRADWPALQEDIEEALAGEENPIPGEKYYYSRLYTHAEGHPVRIDSALYWIRMAQRDWGQTDSRAQERYARFGVNGPALQRQKVWIDSVGYAQALALDTELAYQRFIVGHFDAPQIPEATQHMYSKAYARVLAADTYAAYRDFWNEYPEAPQVAQVQERAQRVAYREFTEPGNADSYRRFIAQFPKSPYRPAAEQALLELTTLHFSQSELRAFIAEFPESTLRARIVAALYHVACAEGQGTELLASIRQWPEWDSLVHVYGVEQHRVFPIWSDSTYRLWRPTNRTFVAQRYRSFPDTLCDTGWPYTWLPLRNRLGKYTLVSRTGQPIVRNTVDEAQDLGAGLVAIKRQGNWGVVHLGGFQVLPTEYEAIKALGSAYLAAQNSDGQWEIFTALGYRTQVPEMEAVQVMDSYLMLSDGNGWHITLVSRLPEWATHTPPPFQFRWQEAEPLASGGLLLYGDDTEAIMDTDGNLLVPEGEWVLEEVGFGWLAEGDGGYGLMLHGRRGFEPTLFENVLYTRGWLALKDDGQWALLHPQQGFDPDYRYDSVRVLGDNVLYVEEGDRKYVQLGDTTQIDIGPGQTPRVYSSPDADQAPDWCAIRTADSVWMYDATGKLWWRTPATGELTRVGAHHFSWTTPAGSALGIDTGALVLPPVFGGIGQAERSFVPLIDGEEGFAVYWMATDTVLETRWEVLPQAYTDTLLIGQQAGGVGLWSVSGLEVLAPNYDEVRYWNATAALCRQGPSWSVIQLRDQQVLLQGLLSIRSWRNGEFVIQTESGYGLVHPVRGMLIEPELEQLEWVGTEQEGFWRGMNYVPAAGWYVFTYLSHYGIRLYRQVVDDDYLDRVYCE